MVKLFGGIQMISAGAFDDCTLLEHGNGMVPAKALLGTGAQGNRHFRFAAEGTFSPSNSTQVVISSECFHSVRPAEVSEVELRIAEILDRQEEWDAQRERLHTFLAPYELRHTHQVTTLLELGLWKAQIVTAQGANAGLSREECRVNCGAAIIVPHVLSFL